MRWVFLTEYYKEAMENHAIIVKKSIRIGFYGIELGSYLVNVRRKTDFLHYSRLRNQSIINIFEACELFENDQIEIIYLSDKGWWA